jgi:hypothetical protein
MKTKLAGLLINLGVSLLPKEAQTSTTIINLMLVKMIKVKIDHCEEEVIN